jgi:casein kinase 1
MAVNFREPKILHNKYVVKNRISSGSFGVVYLAVDKTTKENVAVKIERTEHASMGTLNKEA